MPGQNDIGMLLLHALPLDGSMWAAQMNLHPGATYAPTLYAFGETITDWAKNALELVPNEKIIVVGCSIGGSCALEIAAIAPERVDALVLIGTKASHRREPKLHQTAIDLIENQGVDLAWETYWAPLFSRTVSSNILGAARETALSQRAEELARGVTVFHTRPDRARFVSTLMIPVTVITGEEDIAPGVGTSESIAVSAPFGTLHVIPACGHFVPLEQPLALQQILRDIIAERCDAALN